MEEHEDIDAALKAAKDMRLKYRKGTLNPLSLLPEPKAKLKAALKDRMRQLAGFVEDDDVQFVERNPKSKKTRRIYLKIIEDMETAQKELRRFKLLDL